MIKALNGRSVRQSCIRLSYALKGSSYDQFMKMSLKELSELIEDAQEVHKKK